MTTLNPTLNSSSSKTDRQPDSSRLFPVSINNWSDKIFQPVCTQMRLPNQAQWVYVTMGLRRPERQKFAADACYI